VPHADYGDQECCGIIMPVERGDQADLVCKECGAVIGSVAVDRAKRPALVPADNLALLFRTDTSWARQKV
jgi:hypothetical protein